MINFRIYEMNDHELLTTKLTKEGALKYANSKENINKRIMIVKHDTETKSDEIINRTTGDPYWKNKSCLELKKEIIKRKSHKK